MKDFNVVDNYFSTFWHLAIVIAEFAATWFMVLLGGKIFRTTTLTWPMVGAAFAFGVGCLLVSAALKTIP